jgi:serine/threonine-protein kinase
MSGFPSIPPYRVDALVVTSNFAQVFRAVDTALDITVALKVYRVEPELLSRLPYPEAEWRRRFLREARVLARLDHPHIIRVNAFGHLDNGRPWMAMPYCVANLRREIGRDTVTPEECAALPEGERPRRLAPERARRVLTQLCQALGAMHAQGFVHRDIKPTNLLLTAREDGDIKLCDFGFAKLPSGDSSSGAGKWIGTPDYIAPEQRRDASRVNDRADIYAVGVLAYRLLTGELPLGAFPPPSAVVPGLPGAFDDVVRDAMAPRPELRPPAMVLARRLTTGCAGAGSGDRVTKG